VMTKTMLGRESSAPGCGAVVSEGAGEGMASGMSRAASSGERRCGERGGMG